MITTFKINDMIYFLIKNKYIFNKRNQIIEKYISKKDVTINEVEKTFFIVSKSDEKMIFSMYFWSQYVPFNNDFMLFCFIHYIFDNRIKHITNLFLIGNIREIFMYIRQLLFRNIYDHNNFNDDLDIDLDLLKSKVDGIIKEVDIEKELNISYPFIRSIYENNSKKDKKEIEQTQKENNTFCESIIE